MNALPAPLRRLLENAAQEARDVAEAGALAALNALAVSNALAFPHLNDADKKLRAALRAQARQLGDVFPKGEAAPSLAHLVEKVAYDTWHRLLFTRFLAENQLLQHPGGASVTLQDCEDLVREDLMQPQREFTAPDGRTLAVEFAARMLPAIFRADDPAGKVGLPPEHRNALFKLIDDLPRDVFVASDSLGWCYQFWQARRKEEVNRSGRKIGAAELPSVTQLFTEDYMVDFLLDNTLGAWWAGKQRAEDGGRKSEDRGRKTEDGGQRSEPKTEEEAREAVALPGCPWKYLRFIRSCEKAESGKQKAEINQSLLTSAATGGWIPAAGTFEGWPKRAKELKCLDPCMGSGHFVVAMFERLVALRMAEENLDEAAAVAAVIRDNLFGLEIDPRCTQIAAFNLALAAWRRVGHRPLPAMNLACSGLAPNSREADWLALAGDDGNVQNGMARLYRLFKNAPVLGSLINPRVAQDELLEAAFHQLQPLLEKALAQETTDDNAHEMAVTARGLAKAAEILAGQFTLVATNVPYLSVSKHEDFLRDYGQRCYPDSRHDLATMFVERCLPFGITSALVLPQNWLFLPRYKKLRQQILKNDSWHVVAKLGSGAFETISGEVVKAALVAISNLFPSANATCAGVDVSESASPSDKASALLQVALSLRGQSQQLRSSDARIVMQDFDTENLLVVYADSRHGLRTADGFRFLHCFWEIPRIEGGWSPEQGTVEKTIDFGGREQVVFWEDGQGALREFADQGLASLQGGDAWGKQGLTVSLIGDLPVTRYAGDFFDNNCAALWPRNPKDLAAVWTFCASPEFAENVRVIDQQLKVTSATLLKIPFDLACWQKVAAEKYPNGLPKPFSSDPTQWLFNGHPKGSDNALQVAVARLLGYRWPRQTGSSFPDCPALEPDSLERLAADDGIVCIPAAGQEQPAENRLRALLSAALCAEWSAAKEGELLAQVGYAGKSMEDWLRNGFAEQHGKIFQQRPFVWQIWDGRKDGFSALVNYHKLDRALQDKLIYTYLGDWITRQESGVQSGEGGSDARLTAARDLQRRLKLIAEGEPPYDIFVRWKALACQPMGWEPDLNDGVRLNIRPFVEAGVLRKDPNVNWKKDRGTDPASAPWFKVFKGERINDHHLTLAEKRAARQLKGIL